MAVIRKFNAKIEGIRQELKIKYSAKDSRFLIDGLPLYFFDYLKEYSKDVEHSLEAAKASNGSAVSAKTEVELNTDFVKFLEWANNKTSNKTPWIQINLDYESTNEEIAGGRIYHWAPKHEQIKYSYKIVSKVEYGEVTKFLDDRGNEIYQADKQLLIPDTPENRKFCEDFKLAMQTLMFKMRERFKDSDSVLEAISTNVKLIQ